MKDVLHISYVNLTDEETEMFIYLRQYLCDSSIGVVWLKEHSLFIGIY